MSTVFHGQLKNNVIKSIDKTINNDQYEALNLNILSCYEKCITKGSLLPDDKYMHIGNLSSCINKTIIAIPSESNSLSSYSGSDYNNNIFDENVYAYRDILSSQSQLLTECMGAVAGKGITSASLTSFSDLPNKIDLITAHNSIYTKIWTGKTTAYSYQFLKTLEKSQISRFSSYATKIQVGTGVNNIASNTFEDCSVLETVIIPPQVKTIGSNVFESCSELKRIIFLERKISELSKFKTQCSISSATLFFEDGAYVCSSDSTILPEKSAIISDVHQNANNQGGSKEDFIRALQIFKNRGISHVHICGDLTTNSTSSEIQQFKNIISQYGTGITFDFCGGNHDLGVNESSWQSYYGKSKNYYTINGNYAYVYYSILNSDNKNPYETSDWLKTLLEGDLKSKKVFLFMHYPMTAGNTTSQYAGICYKTANTNKQYFDGFTTYDNQNSTLLSLFEAHGNIVVFSGHSHYAFEIEDEEESLIVYEFSTCGTKLVHVPSLGYPRNLDGADAGINRNNVKNQPAQCFLMDIYPDTVVLKGFDVSPYGDIKNGFEYPRFTYALDITNSSEYTKIYFTSSSGKAMQKKLITGTVTADDIPRDSQCSYDETIEKIEFGTAVTMIGAHAVTYCSALKTVVIPSSVTYIHTYAFGYCYNLANLTIENSNCAIASTAFLECRSIQIGTFTCSASSLPNQMFYGNSSLYMLTFKNNTVNEIKNTYASYLCIGVPALQQVYCKCSDGYIVINERHIEVSSSDDDPEPTVTGTKVTYVDNTTKTFQINGELTWQNIGKPNDYTDTTPSMKTVVGNSSVTTIGPSAFFNCYLTTASFPACTTIGSYAFYSCSSLTTVSFPACTTICSSAFYNCYSLTTASFPACTTIGSYAFYSCPKLTSLYLTGSSVCSLAGTNAFTNTPIANGTGSIYVPQSLLTTYQNATNWTYYSSRFVGI